MAKLPTNYEVNQRQANSFERKPNADYVQFFPKMADGEELIVRFPYSNVDDVDVRTVHSVKSGNRYITVDCVRLENEPFEKCPLCTQKYTDEKTGLPKMTFPVKKRGFIRMIYYKLDENNVITPFATVWNCAADYATQIKSYIREYGNLSTMVFKLKKRGTGMDTKYDIIPANKEFYTSEEYKIDFHAFENFNISPWHLLEATASDLNTFLTTGTFPQFEPKESTAYTAPATPAYTNTYIAPTPVVTPAWTAPETTVTVAPATQNVASYAAPAPATYGQPVSADFCRRP